MIAVLMVAFLVIALLVALGAKHGSRPCELSFRVATYGGNSYISEIEINDEGRLVAMTHNDVIGKHSPYPLQSEGAVEYYVSVRFGVWAEKELGEKYNSRNKGWKTFSLSCHEKWQAAYLQRIHKSNRFQNAVKEEPHHPRLV